MNCELENEDVVCGKPATLRLRFEDESEVWVNSCEDCAESCRGNEPFVVILEEEQISA